MMFAMLLAFVQPVCHAFCDTWLSTLMNKMFKSRLSTMFYTQIVTLAVLPLLFFFGMPTGIGFAPAALLALAIAMDVFLLLLYYYALKFVDASVSQALWNFGDAATPFMGMVLFGEYFSPYAAVGFLMIIAASIFVAVDDFKRPRLGKGFWLMLLVAFIFSGWVLLIKAITGEIGWVNAAFWNKIGMGAAAFLFLSFPRGRAVISADRPAFKRNIKPFAVYGLFSMLGSFSVMFALGALPLVVREGISGTQPFFVLIFAWLFARIGLGGAREDMKMMPVIKKIVCFTTMLVGLSLLVGF